MEKIITKFLKFLMIIISIWLLNHIWTSRYEINSADTFAYKLDTWTGKVSFLDYKNEYPLKKEKQ